ncbi:hypothetical protein CRENPOLYSF2_2700003 [Crenothrix polyspora]|uniref:Uncharacterized protein n=1 Tax=Crenothrix polyspora TaxID=360316 RepID=A0A1R4H893_9GAMM|nr:hypothetical protein CRENPOLYSF2_2700003 [Crenothrix polyspora]
MCKWGLEVRLEAACDAKLDEQWFFVVNILCGNWLSTLQL